MASDIGKVEIEYFPFYGRASAVRYLMAFKGVDFEDKEIQFEEWATLKTNTDKYPHGGLPVFVIQGMRMGQTMAVMRNLAIQLGLYPCEDAELAWNCDSLMD